MSDFELPSFGPTTGAQNTRAALQRHFDGFRISILNGVEDPLGLKEFTEATRTFLGMLEALAPVEAPVATSRKARKAE